MGSPEEIVRIGWISLLVLLLVCAGAWFLFSPTVVASCLGGGLLGLVNFLVLVWLFRQIVAGGSATAWYVLPLIGKSGVLLAMFAFAALVFRADVLALAVGFSIVVFTVAAVGSVQYLRRAREDRA